MRFVVERHHAPEPQELGHDAPQHLSFAFKRLDFAIPVYATVEKRAAALGDRHCLAQLESVEVGDDDLRPFQVAQHFGRDEFTTAVVAVRVVRQRYAEAVADRYARRRHQKASGKAPAVRPTNRVHGFAMRSASP